MKEREIHGSDSQKREEERAEGRTGVKTGSFEAAGLFITVTNNWNY